MKHWFSARATAWLCTAALAIGGISACGQAQPEVALSSPASYTISDEERQRNDLADYSDASYPFSMKLPREWYVGELSGATYGIVIASSNDPSVPRATINVLVEPLDGPIDIAQAAQTAEDTLQQQGAIGNFQREAARSAVVNKLAGQERSYRYTLDGAQFRQRSVYLVGQDHLYAISLIAPADIYAQHERMFNTVLATFEGA